MVKYRLIYFNARGRAEIIRFIFAYAKVPFEDFRVEKQDWPLYKPKTLFGQLPVLEIMNDDGTTIQLAQSMSIARYLANEFNLVGSTSLEKARCDMIVDQLVDLFNQYSIVHYYETDEKLKQEKMEKLYREIFPYYIGLFEKLLESQKTLFLASDTITWADLALAAFLDILEDKKELILGKFELTKTIDKKINNLPDIIEWKRIRPKTVM